MILLTKGLNSNNKGIKGPTRKRITSKLIYYNLTDKKLRSFNNIKITFTVLSFLVYFNKNRPLYINLDSLK